MSIAGLLPALSLLAGAIVGLTIRLDPWVLVCCLPPVWFVACLAWWRRVSWLVMSALASGLVMGGAALSADALENALHSAARVRLDSEFGGFRLDDLGPGGRHDPLATRLLLVEDAALRDGFVSLRGELLSIRLRGSWQPIAGGIAASVSGAAAADVVSEWREGRIIEAPMTFRRPGRYLNEGVPDFERNLALDGVTLLGTVKSGLLVSIAARGSVLSEFAGEIRSHVRQAVAAWIEPHDPVSAAIAAAVLIGDRAGLPDETRKALQMAGTYHVIAISGGNIAILAAAATLALMLVGIRGRHASAAAIVVLVGYVLVITSGPSVWRATLTAVLYFTARAIDQRTAVWHASAVTAALMIAGRPLDVRDPGFILTFGATIALLHGGRLGAALMPRNRLASWIVASLVASAAVEIVLLPVSATLFSQVTVAGLVLNLLAVPLMGVVQIASLAVAVVTAVPVLAASAAYVAHLAAQTLVGSAELVTIVPWATARVPPPGPVLVGAYYAALAVSVTSPWRWLRFAAIVTMLAAGLVISGVIRPVGPTRAEDGKRTLRLSMFDVGQGEAILLETPGGERILVDAGGTPFGGGLDIGARVLAPALWARGVRSLDALVVTHGDPDHLGGAPDVVADFAPPRLWVGVPVAAHRPTRELFELVRRRGGWVDRRRAGERFQRGDAVIRVLHPPEPDWERRGVRNDDSVVLEVVYRDVAILLTGDISADVERDILPHLTYAPSRILKVAHHGSRTSTSNELLQGWRPQIALISAGRGNTFGHPAPEVLQRLDKIGATVLRTDLDGQIDLDTDGAVVTYKTYVGRPLTFAHSSSISTSVAAESD